MSDEPVTVEQHELQVRMHGILVQMQMLSFGSTQAWNASGGHSGEPDDRVVAQVIRHDDPPHIEFRRRWNGCRTLRARRLLVEEAERDLASYRRRTAPLPESLKTEMDLMLEDGEGFEPGQVAAKFGVAEAYVRRQRQRYGRDPESGRLAEGVARVVVAAAERRGEALRLLGCGWSTRRVAEFLGVHQTQVMRWTRDQG